MQLGTCTTLRVSSRLQSTYCCSNYYCTEEVDKSLTAVAR